MAAQANGSGEKNLSTGKMMVIGARRRVNA
jgi:hypothetical protein